MCALVWNCNEVTEKLRISYPIFQAPMAGGITTSELISETSNCGGLGNLGAGYMKPDEIKEIIKEIKNLTNKPFGVNLFVPEAQKTYLENDYEAMSLVLSKYEKELGIEKAPQIQEVDDKALFENQLEEVLKAKIPVCSFTFGIPDEYVIRELKKQGAIVIGTATNVKEALELEENGSDMIVAQGSEAGGHRGTFHKEEGGLIGSMALIPQVADAISKPVIAAGGIMDSRGIAAAMILGAKGVQLGTAFLTCKESGAHRVYKQALLHSTEEQTTLTKAFSGKLARGISNRFIEEMSSHTSMPFPLQNGMTGPIRNQAAKLAQSDFMSLWAGQGVRKSKETTVRILIEELVEEIGNYIK